MSLMLSIMIMMQLSPFHGHGYAKNTDNFTLIIDGTPSLQQDWSLITPLASMMNLILTQIMPFCYQVLVLWEISPSSGKP